MKWFGRAKRIIWNDRPTPLSLFNIEPPLLWHGASGPWSNICSKICYDNPINIFNIGVGWKQWKNSFYLTHGGSWKYFRWMSDSRCCSTNSNWMKAFEQRNDKCWYTQQVSEKLTVKLKRGIFWSDSRCLRMYTPSEECSAIANLKNSHIGKRILLGGVLGMIHGRLCFGLKSVKFKLFQDEKYGGSE